MKTRTLIRFCLITILVVTAEMASAQTATVPVNTAVANFLSFTLRGGGGGIAITVVNAFAEVVRQ